MFYGAYWPRSIFHKCIGESGKSSSTIWAQEKWWNLPFFPWNLHISSAQAAVTLAFGCIATARAALRTVRVAGRRLQQMLGEINAELVENHRKIIGKWWLNGTSPWKSPCANNSFCGLWNPNHQLIDGLSHYICIGFQWFPPSHVVQDFATIQRM